MIMRRPVYRSFRLATGAVMVVGMLSAPACRTDGSGAGAGTSLFGPTGQPWTIECIRLAGPSHRENAKVIANVLRRTPGIDATRVKEQHDRDASVVYYGSYDRRLDRRTGDRDIPDALQRDLKLIKELIDDQGRRIFVAARMVPQPVRATGPEELDLNNAKGKYTLQVAAFFACDEIANYRQAAIDFAVALRQRGYEAYYHHGESQSVVTVGTFGDEALIERGGKWVYSPAVRALQRKESFAYNLTNGAVWRPIVGGEKGVVASQLVKIPHDQHDGFQ